MRRPLSRYPSQQGISQSSSFCYKTQWSRLICNLFIGSEILEMLLHLPKCYWQVLLP